MDSEGQGRPGMNYAFLTMLIDMLQVLFDSKFSSEYVMLIDMLLVLFDSKFSSEYVMYHLQALEVRPCGEGATAEILLPMIEACHWGLDVAASGRFPGSDAEQWQARRALSRALAGCGGSGVSLEVASLLLKISLVEGGLPALESQLAPPAPPTPPASPPPEKEEPPQELESPVLTPWGRPISQWPEGSIVGFTVGASDSDSAPSTPKRRQRSAGRRTPTPHSAGASRQASAAIGDITADSATYTQVKVWKLGTSISAEEPLRGVTPPGTPLFAASGNLFRDLEDLKSHPGKPSKGSEDLPSEAPRTPAPAEGGATEDEGPIDGASPLKDPASAGAANGGAQPAAASEAQVQVQTEVHTEVHTMPAADAVLLRQMLEYLTDNEAIVQQHFEAEGKAEDKAEDKEGTGQTKSMLGHMLLMGLHLSFHTFVNQAN